MNTKKLKRKQKNSQKKNKPTKMPTINKISGLAIWSLLQDLPLIIPPIPPKNLVNVLFGWWRIGPSTRTIIVGFWTKCRFCHIMGSFLVGRDPLEAGSGIFAGFCL